MFPGVDSWNLKKKTFVTGTVFNCKKYFSGREEVLSKSTISHIYTLPGVFYYPPQIVR
jgi:hypothetical protein